MDEGEIEGRSAPVLRMPGLIDATPEDLRRVGSFESISTS